MNDPAAQARVYNRWEQPRSGFDVINTPFSRLGMLENGFSGLDARMAFLERARGTMLSQLVVPGFSLLVFR